MQEPWRTCEQLHARISCFWQGGVSIRLDWLVWDEEFSLLGAKVGALHEACYSNSVCHQSQCLLLAWPLAEILLWAWTRLHEIYHRPLLHLRGLLLQVRSAQQVSYMWTSPFETLPICCPHLRPGCAFNDWSIHCILPCHLFSERRFRWWCLCLVKWKAKRHSCISLRAICTCKRIIMERKAPDPWHKGAQQSVSKYLQEISTVNERCRNFFLMSHIPCSINC